MFTGMELMTCQNLAVPVEVMQQVVRVESGANPYAIGVVGGQLVRQPQNLGEALATVHMLDAKGFNYSLGVAQVNRANLGKYGLDSYEKAFEVCPNLAAGSRILAACYASSGGDWVKSFSCYYSGNFVTGYRDGYVQKVYDSIHRGADASVGPSQAIPLLAQSGVPHGMKGMPSDGPAYRVAIRSELLDTAASALVPAIGNAPGAAPDGVISAQPQPAPPLPHAPSKPNPTSDVSAEPVSATNNAAASVFLPRVRGPNDAAPAVTTAAVQPRNDASPGSSGPVDDHADLRQGNRDAAFVF